MSINHIMILNFVGLVMSEKVISRNVNTTVTIFCGIYVITNEMIQIYVKKDISEILPSSLNLL